MFWSFFYLKNSEKVLTKGAKSAAAFAAELDKEVAKAALEIR